MARFEIRLFGPVSIIGPAGEVSVAGPLECTLLALLASRPGEVIGVDTLIDELWGVTLPQDPRASLRTHVARVRAWLGRAGVDRQIIGFERGGYRLAIDRQSVDLLRFSDAVALSESANNHEAVLAACNAALAEWRGEPLAGCAVGLVLEAEQVRYREQRLQVIERRAVALLALDRAPEAVVELAARRRENPSRERLTELLMVALYRTGRQQEALAAYSETRRHLAEEYGLMPGPDLERTEGQILAHDPQLLSDQQKPTEARPTSATWLPTSSGDLTPRELAEASRLADHLGRWVEQLADDDPRLPAAEATRDQLNGELRLPVPRRPMLRACIQSALDLLRSDVEQFTEELAGVLHVDVEQHPDVTSDVEGAAPIDEPDPAAEEAYGATSDTITELAEAAADVLADDQPALNDVERAEEEKKEGGDEVDERPGRGTLLVRFGKWASTEAGSAVIQASAVGGATVGAPWLAKAPGALVQLVEALLNLVGL